MSNETPSETPPPPSHKGSRLYILGLTLLFVGGIVLGSLGTILALKFGFHDHRRMKDHPLHRIERVLDLNEEQKKTVTPILEEAENRMRELRHRTRPEMRSILDDAKQKMRPHLSPDQLEKLEEIGRKKP